MNISVVIVTKNRAHLLLHCLSGLAVQSIKPSEIVIIDNNSSDETRNIIKKFQENTKLNIRYSLCRKRGYPVIYNQGLFLAKSEWVAFIDDDCFPSFHWLESIQNNAKENVDVLVGHSETYFQQNPVSLATNFFDQLWKLRGQENNTIVDYEILDNKNIAYRKQFIKEHCLQYDETRVKYDLGSSEDADLGMQIYTHGGKAKLVAEMTIFHKDPTSLSSYLSRTTDRGIGHLQYEQKWKSERKNIKKIKVNTSQLLFTMIKNKKLSFSTTVQLLFVIKLTILIKYIQKICAVIIPKQFSQS